MHIEELDELLDYLDLDSEDGFSYFENFADIAEFDGFIEEDAMFSLICGVDKHTFAELCESYFYDVLENVPGDEIDLYNLLDNIKRVIIGLAQEAKNSEDMTKANRMLSEEFNRFRTWYSVDDKVECVNLDNGEVVYLPVRDAICQARLEKITTDRFRYDFTDALNYELEEYIMTYADLAEEM